MSRSLRNDNQNSDRLVFRKALSRFFDTVMVVLAWFLVFCAKFVFVIACYSFTHGEKAIRSLNNSLTVNGIAESLNLLIIYLLVAWIYFAIAETSEKKATFGMRLAKLSVADACNQQISLGRATGRLLLNPSFWFGLAFTLYFLSDEVTSKLIPNLFENVCQTSLWMFYCSIVFVILQAIAVIFSSSGRSLTERLTCTIEYHTPN